MNDPRRARRRLLVAAFFIALAIVNSYPLVLGLNSSVGAHGDALFSVWRLAWVAHQIRDEPARLFDANIFFPEQSTLAYSDAMLLPAVVVAPLNWAGVSPLLVYNLTLLAAFVASGVSAYALVRYLTGRTAAGILGGVVFAFAPHRAEHFDHLELQFAFWIPLACLAWHRATADDSVRRHLAVGALVSGQILSCIYHGIFLVTWLGALTAWWYWREPRRAVRAVALSLAVPIVVLGVYSLPYLESRTVVGERRAAEIEGYSAQPLDFLSAPATNRVYGATSEWGANERHLFPGVVAVLLLALGGWRTTDRRIRAHLVGLIVGLVLTFGFNAGVYRALYEWVLPYRGLRVPARAAILVLLSLSVVAGAGLAWIQNRFRARVAPLVAAALIAVASVEYWSTPRLLPVDPRPSGWYKWLGSIPDAVVFEWPVTVPWRLYDMRDVHYMYRSTYHWRPLLNGYSGTYPRSYLELLLQMRSFPYTSSLDYLRRRGATILVVHERHGTRPSYDDALERLHRDPYVTLVAQGRDNGSRVSFFRLLPKPPRTDARASRPDGP